MMAVRRPALEESQRASGSAGRVCVPPPQDPAATPISTTHAIRDSLRVSIVSDRRDRRLPITAMIVLPRAAIATIEPLHPAHHLLPARDQHDQRDEQEAVPERKRDRKR